MVKALSLAAPLLLLAGCLPEGFGVFLPERTDRYALPGNEIPAPLLEELALVAEDGVALAAMLARQEASAAAPTVVYLHGQSGNLDDYWGDVQRLWRAGYNVLALDYRGYGKSGGEPSEAGLYLDAAAAFAAARGHAALDPDRLVVWGYSLGTGVASHLALSAPAALLVLEAPFTSLAAMVEGASPYAIEPDWFTDVRFDTLGRIDELALPLVVVYGEEDRRVPRWMAEAVFDAARVPKRFVAVAGAGHSDALERGLEAIVAAAAELAPAAAPP
jgi:pimeloyl-ACP methyl ester carboxylesterase